MTIKEFSDNLEFLMSEAGEGGFISPEEMKDVLINYSQYVNMFQNTEITPFEMGVKAYCRNKSFFDNPFFVICEKEKIKQWADGWGFAQQYKFSQEKN